MFPWDYFSILVGMIIDFQRFVYENNVGEGWSVGIDRCFWGYGGSIEKWREINCGRVARGEMRVDGTIELMGGKVLFRLHLRPRGLFVLTLGDGSWNHIRYEWFCDFKEDGFSWRHNRPADLMGVLGPRVMEREREIGRRICFPYVCGNVRSGLIGVVPVNPFTFTPVFDAFRTR